jgi:predicted CXXCH cytochrome family protein
MNFPLTIPIILITLFILRTGEAHALPKSYSVTDTHNRHNLSTSGPGMPGITKATAEPRVCIFCHTPHHATAIAPLWSRELSSAIYTPYASTTLRATPKPGQPTGASRLCLSCHDGTISLGMLTAGMQITGLTPIPSGRLTNLGTDLSADHPISFSYASAITSTSELNQPQQLSPAITLEKGMLECTACHDPHRDLYPPVNQPTNSGNFLVMDNTSGPTGSALCVSCHNLTGWAGSGHAIPNVDSCGNCHTSHKADQPTRLLKGTSQDPSLNLQATCLANCHKGGGTPGADVRSAFTTSKAHQPGVVLITGTHDDNENPLSFKSNFPHVECVDCHNPHQAKPGIDPLAVPPSINGLPGLQGVTIATQPNWVRVFATNEYDICFKCHSTNHFSPPAIPRQFPLNGTGDETLRFDSNNPSYHPVTNVVKSTNIPSASGLSLRQAILINGTNTRTLTTTSQIYCSDCHDPHGSPVTHLLNAAYYTESTSPTSFNSLDYDLCFRCHDQNVLFSSNSSFPPHQFHVQSKLVPCSVCHDPHGVTSTNAHLINFDLRFVSPTTPVPVYQSMAPKSCTVSCHSTGSPNPFTHTY